MVFDDQLIFICGIVVFSLVVFAFFSDYKQEKKRKKSRVENEVEIHRERSRGEM